MAEDTQVGWAAGPSGTLEPLHRTAGSTNARADVERLRVLVQALEEEVAARQEDGERLAGMLRVYRTQAQVDSPARQCAAASAALDAHDALTARYAPGGPDPLPDPVEGDTEALSDQSGEIRCTDSWAQFGERR